MSLTGGYFPVELKFAGYDVMIIEGKSEKPVYLSIKDGNVKFRSAEKVWGMKTTDTQQIIKNELNDQNTRIACIGPAGENQVRLANVITGGVTGARAAGRGGVGAVMGSKNLKAVAVRGTGRAPLADREAVGRLARWLRDNYRELMGATNPADADEGTIRKTFSLSLGENSVHGSDSPESAKREISLNFSDDEIVG